MKNLFAGGRTQAAVAPSLPVARRRFRFSSLMQVPYIPMFIIVVFMIVAVFGSVFSPYDPGLPNLRSTYRPPFWQEGGSTNFLLGTDNLGRDMFSRLILGARVSLIVIAVGIPGHIAIGVTLGLISGYMGRGVDTLIQRVVDVYLAFPTILLALALIPVLGPGMKSILIIIIVTGWAGYARIIRAEVLSVKSRDFVALAKVAGASELRIMLNHILPQVVNTILVISTLQVGSVIIFEASLSFLGIGTQPPLSSWGQILSDGRQFVSTAWWIAFFPGICIVLLCLSANLLGDWVRDKLDPRLRQL
ncbi:MAG: ABC transporter permease [Dehalococcoidia bacterium]|nr:ABC transporter permease [Dehalococcoidia bacterium]